MLMSDTPAIQVEQLMTQYSKSNARPHPVVSSGPAVQSADLCRRVLDLFCGARMFQRRVIS